MTRNELIVIIQKHLDLMYGIVGDAEITIEEINMVDNVLRETFKKNQEYFPQNTYCHSEKTKQLISEKCKGRKLSEATKERMRENSQRITVYQYDMDGNLVNVWKSTREAGRAGYESSCISKCCRGLRKSAYGYIWRYKPIDDEDGRIKITVKQVKSIQ